MCKIQSHQFITEVKYSRERFEKSFYLSISWNEILGLSVKSKQIDILHSPSLSLYNNVAKESTMFVFGKKKHVFLVPELKKK